MVDERYEQATGLDAAEGILWGKGKERGTKKKEGEDQRCGMKREQEERPDK